MSNNSNSSKLKSNFADGEAYEKRIRRFVPSYYELMDSILCCLPEKEGNFSVLELGCGIGNLSLQILQKNPFFTLTAIDLVEEMVAACGERLKKYSNRAEVVCADQTRFSRPNAFDFILSNLSLHYPETDEKKISTCKNVFISLKTGGIFSFSVMLIGDTPEETEKIWRNWEKEVLNNGVTPEELEEWYRTNHGTDYPVSVNQWLKWLEEVGFEKSKLVWQKTIFGTICAKKL